MNDNRGIPEGDLEAAGIDSYQQKRNGDFLKNEERDPRKRFVLVDSFFNFSFRVELFFSNMSRDLQVVNLKIYTAAHVYLISTCV